MHFRFGFIMVLCALSYSKLSYGQEKKGLFAKKIDEVITIDGDPKEAIWQEAEAASNFYQYFPNDTSYAVANTEAFVAYDDKNVYILLKVYDDLEGEYQTSSLRRDYRGGANDGISIVIDTYQDNTNAFVFGINPYGVLREGLIANGGQGRDAYSLSWDNKWVGEAKIFENMWVAEAAIPLKTLRFKDQSKFWNINFYRIDTKYNERSTWTPIPRNNSIYNLAFLQPLEFEQPLKKPGGNVAIIPYASVNGFVDNQADESIGEKPQGGGYGFGGDIKLGVSPSLNLDLTINPDFSQVEVDRQQTNLSRFELFFPERRQFFLENADLFANFGGNRSRPFFSRRIGITKDTLTDQNVSQPILFGARLSGKVSKNLRVGVLSMQTAAVEEANQPSLNYSVGVIQQKVFARSNISAIFVNKQELSFEDKPTPLYAYNRVAGLEYNLATASNNWTGKLFYHHSFEPDNPDSTFSYGSSLSYNKRRFTASFGHQIIGNNFNAEVGFVPRRGFQQLNSRVQVWFYPNTMINRHGFSGEVQYLWSSTGVTSDHRFELGYNLTFQSQAFINLNFVEEYTLLFNDFDPTRTDGEPLPAGSDYTYRYVQLRMRTDERKALVARLNGSAGQFFNGERYSIGGNLNYRFQPYGNIGVDVQYNSILLPDPHNSADLVLIGPRLDITFSRSVFLTGLFQYNNQVDNFNTNIRFQWRFKPVSDLYVVYTDNYFASDFMNKNRSLIVKLTYWLNL